MEEKVADLKQDFHDWLARQGLSEKTKAGRPGTIYEYIRQIDRICDIVQLNHNKASWKWLAKNVYPILAFYILCRNGPVVINYENKDYLTEFWNAFFNTFSNTNEKVQNHLVIQAHFPGAEPNTTYKVIYQLLFKSLEKGFGELTLSINTSKSVSKNERKALQKFYQFLSDTLYDGKATDSRDIRKLKFQYHQLSYNLDKIECFGNPKFVSYYIKVESGCYRYPPQFSPSYNGERYVDKEEVKKLLQVSEWYLEELDNSELEIPLLQQYDGKYLIDDVNVFIEKCFHPSPNQKETPNLKNICYWWTPEEIAKKFHITRRRVGQVRETVAYIRIGPGKYLYYPYEFKKYAKKSTRIHEKRR